MQQLLRVSKRRDVYAGALMVALGLAVSGQSLTYTLGTLSQMGPGFFPLAIGVIMTLLGVAIIATAKPSPEPEPAEAGGPQWRGWICITLGILAFIVLGTHGGLVPATFAVVFISAMGDRRNTWRSASLLALAAVVVAVVVFWWALHIPFPLFHW
jgi:hypothetical protein